MKKFNMIDEVFTCENCGKNVDKLNYTARDHCPYCLYSKHVDINPGDRMNECKGLLEPIGIEKFKDTYKIIYKCKKCNQMIETAITSSGVRGTSGRVTSSEARWSCRPQGCGTPLFRGIVCPLNPRNQGRASA